MKRLIFAFVVVFILVVGCTSESTPTLVPPIVTPTPAPTSTLVPPTATLIPPTATFTPTSTPTLTLTPTPPLPKSGDWNATADALGDLVFRVSDDAKQITLVSVNFIQFACQGKGIKGKWLPSAFSSAITNRQFALSGVLAGYMELSMTGQSPGIAAFPEFTFSGKFDETGTQMNGAWKADWAGASCSGTWRSAGSSIATSATTPTATPLAPVPTSAEPFFLYPYCNCQADVPAGKAGYLRWGWVAVKEEWTRDFIAASQTTVIIDGKPYTGLDKYWGEISYRAEYGGYGSTWVYPLPALAPGKHRVETRVSLNRSLTDGYDENKDGQPDQYGPGDAFYGWVDVQIPVATAATEPAGACPNGAPKGTWMLIVNKTQPGDGTITIDGETKPIRSGRNVFYLTVGKSHQILVGTNTIGYSAPECGENTLNVP